MSLLKPNSLNLALEEIDNGNFAFPCNAKKKPACERGFKAAVNTPEQAEALWRGTNAPLLGIDCERSNIWVLDIDAKGKEWLEQYRGLIPETLTYQTPSGGNHFVFKGHPTIRNSQGKISEGVDVRGIGGYVCRGEGYQIIHDAEIADASPELISLALEANAGTASSQVPAPVASHSIDRRGKLTDGREDLMTKMVYAKCVQAANQMPLKDVEAYVLAQYPDYEDKAAPRGQSLEADGRGFSEYQKKTRYLLEKFAREGVPPETRQADRHAAAYVYNATSDQVIRLSDGTTFKREPWRVMTGRNIQKDVADDLIMVVKSTAFEPSQPRLFYLDGELVFNVYPICPVPVADSNFQNHPAIDTVTGHLKWMFPDDYEFVLDWLAFNVQNYAQKLRYAVVVVGIQGDGKTTLFDKLPRAVLGHQHVVTVGPQQINGNYNEWAVNTGYLCCEEITVNGTMKTQVMEQIKPLVTNDMISVTQRYQDARQVRNTANAVILTNHKNALPIDPNDRRYHVLKTHPDKRAELPDEAHFKALHQAIENNREVLRGYLMARDLTDFNVNRPPPATSAKVFMREAQLHETSLRVMEVLRNPTRGIHSQCFSFASMRETLRTNYNYELNFRNAEAFMEQIGFIKYPKNIKWENKSHTIYAHEELMAQNPSSEILRTLLNNPDDEAARWLDEDEFPFDE